MAEENYQQLSIVKEELKQNKQSQQTIQTQLDEQNRQIETLNQQIEQLIQENTRNQQDAQGNLTIKNQEITNARQQCAQLQQELNQFTENLRVQPQLLNIEFCLQVWQQIETKVKKTIKCSLPMYQATKDGLNHTSFWNKINGKSNLLIVCKSKSGNIFGAFSPCQWLQTINTYVQDDTLSSFIFSQTHNQFYPLKEANKANAIYSYSTYGPTFGNGHDLQIDTDFQSGSSALGTAYQIGEYEILDATTHLYGQGTPNLDECEIFELILK